MSLYDDKFKTAPSNPLLDEKLLDNVRNEFFNRIWRDNPNVLKNIDESSARRIFRELLEGKAAPHYINEAMEVLVRDMYGWGPVSELMANPDISDIWINRHNEIIYEENGEVKEHPKHFLSEEHLRRTAERMAASVGRKVDESRPVEDCRLPDGSRVAIFLPSVSPRGTNVTIRKFSRLFTLEELAERKVFPKELIRMFQLFVKARLNIYAAGGMGSGKNTFLNALMLCVGPKENLVFVEDPAESKVGLPDPDRPGLPRPKVKVYEPRRAGAGGVGEVPLSLIFEKILRIKPTRVLVSESRCPETTYYTLQAMNIGHPGSMSSVHAESPEDVPLRLSDMLAAYSGGSYKDLAARVGKIAVVEVIVYLTQIEGRRKLTDIVEVRRAKSELPEVIPLYRYNHEGVNPDGVTVGDLEPTGVKPDFLNYRKISLYLSKEEREELGAFFKKGDDQKC